MVSTSLFRFLYLLVLLHSTFASPVSSHNVVARAGSVVNISTAVGSATGVVDSSAVRFPVKYASADRWQPSVMSSSWILPDNSTDPTAMPLACPQPASSENSAATSEDCLSMVLYVPTTAASTKFSTMVWIHGGSFIVGSASGPGLDGAKLASATGSIVAVVQYRLGAFGFLDPHGESNLAVKDMINALQFLQQVLPSFGGDSNEITIAGQSSGATMVRALLAAPSASGLFNRASLHSDPMNYGFLSTSTFETLNNNLIERLGCDASDSGCLDSISTDNLTDISFALFQDAANLDASAGAFMPMRPVTDGTLITSPLDLTATFPKQSKTIMVSTVKNEAGPTIYGNFNSSMSEQTYEQAVVATFGDARSAVIMNSSFYTAAAVGFADASSAAVDARTQLELLGTDQVWRCPSWSFAREFASAGGTVYVGEYIRGVTYPSNADIAFCAQGGTHVCHEDDIEIVFGTGSNPSSDARALTTQIQKRYKSFLAGGTPNAQDLEVWTTVSGNTTNAIALGANGGKIAVGGCDPSFWGSAVEYDYQVFGI